MAWTMYDVGLWVDEHGGINTEGGLSDGLDALEVALAERRFDAERERVAREFLRIRRGQLETMARLRREMDEHEGVIHDAHRRIEDKDIHRIELQLNALGVHAARSQADSSRKALRVSWLGCSSRSRQSL